MNPSLTELRVFVTMADCPHFTRAAEQLGVSQSTLSASLARLEKVFGTRLFDRNTRACRLTEAGEALLPSARRLLGDWENLLGDAQDLARVSLGKVTIAAPNAQCAFLLPPAIRTFLESHPGVRFVLHDVPEHEVRELVRNGTADLGIATQSDARSDLISTPWFADEFVAVMAPDHPLAARRALEWSQVAREAVIGYLPGNPVRQLLEQKLAQRGLSLNYAFEIALPWTMMGLAREALGVAVVTMALRPIATWHGLLIRSVGRPQLARTMVLLRSQGNRLSPAAAAFRELLIGTRGDPLRTGSGEGSPGAPP